MGSKDPSLLSLAINTSEVEPPCALTPPVVVSVLSPKDASPLKEPVIIDEPSLKEVIAALYSPSDPPAFVAQAGEPSGLNLTMKTSELPDDLAVRSPKEASPRKEPVTIDEPSYSEAIFELLELLNILAHKNEPSGFDLAMNPS